MHTVSCRLLASVFRSMQLACAYIGCVCLWLAEQKIGATCTHRLPCAMSRQILKAARNAHMYCTVHYKRIQWTGPDFQQVLILEVLYVDPGEWSQTHTAWPYQVYQHQTNEVFYMLILSLHLSLWQDECWTVCLHLGTKTRGKKLIMMQYVNALATSDVHVFI